MSITVLAACINTESEVKEIETYLKQYDQSFNPLVITVNTSDSLTLGEQELQKWARCVFLNES
jgi:hypothetical protein